MKTLEAKYGGGKKIGPVLLPQRRPITHHLPPSKSQQKRDIEQKREASEVLINHG